MLGRLNAIHLSSGLSSREDLLKIIVSIQAGLPRMRDRGWYIPVFPMFFERSQLGVGWLIHVYLFLIFQK